MVGDAALGVARPEDRELPAEPVLNDLWQVNGQTTKLSETNVAGDVEGVDLTRVSWLSALWRPTS